MKILCVMGARPNFVKVAALYRAFAKCPEFSVKLVHTGQHHDDAMYRVFLTQLGLPDPDYSLSIHGGSHTAQTARIMLAFENVLASESPDMVIVVGDVNSSLACALVAAKEGVPLVHVEAGLRSGDKSMPEEINRILIDQMSGELFVSEELGVSNLRSEGIGPDNIHFVGNVMIDSLVYCREKASELSVTTQLGLRKNAYIVMTMHRPSNVDSSEDLMLLVALIEAVCKLRPVVFPIHPRTKSNLIDKGIWHRLETIEGLHLLPPQGYLEFINLTSNAELVITDSGGVQEETTFFGVPCITFRNSTERPSTVGEGTNRLVGGLNVANAMHIISEVINGEKKPTSLPALWDGFASDRIVQIIKKKYLK
ncbi:UDP-N-acetylglucosamine 2-epimerase (non-hydrolysing) [Dyadobacter soli]|uniref:UDP-N-acetylglucosamine 2-epimerase (Non-hydrolysing) n=1 Tax=Dyadobacter soli TaxID=659014 RepID=A0A1G7HWE2_9BACT|nr:UDP-N-acetylglucosamine 2-epimerase (non-hydrolyzing) [Dyadobacter soli]SDF04673.1 UDP-N-acetylglucosamine 2-epimerase (non-hydrolysing) [Dyadobacter soli]